MSHKTSKKHQTPELLINGSQVTSCLNFGTIYVTPTVKSNKPTTAQRSDGMTNKGFFTAGCYRKFPTCKE